MQRVTEIAYRLVLATCAVVLLALVLVVAYQILGRHVPFIPRALWTEEVARMGLVWLVFLGAAAGVRSSEHFLIDLVPRNLKERWLRVIATLALGLVGIISALLLVGSIGFLITGGNRISTTLGTPMTLSFLAPVVSTALMLLFAAQVWREAMADPRGVRFQQRDDSSKKSPAPARGDDRMGESR